MGQVGDAEADGDGRRWGDDDAGDVREFVPQPGQQIDTLHALGNSAATTTSHGSTRPAAGPAPPRPRRTSGRVPSSSDGNAPTVSGLAHEQDVATHVPTIGADQGPGKEDSGDRRR